MRVPLLALLLLAGCSSASDPAEAVCGAAEILVDVATSDGLTLVADYHSAAEADRGALVLLHMSPADNDRSGYGPVVRETLRDAGWSVLNLDRRGAGGSQGDAVDATRGEGGRLDVEAAVGFLVDPARVCAVDAQRIVLIAASNGTTSAFDYAVDRATALPPAAGQAWLSPGEYTEARHEVGDHIESLGPMLWLYPGDEPWAEVYRAAPAEDWTFARLGDQHGTHIFDEEPLRSDALLAITGWLDER